LETLDIIDTYFAKEKVMSIVFFLLGLLAVVVGLFFWWNSKSLLLQGAIAPLLILGLISGVVGGSIYLRTNSQVSTLKQTYSNEPIRFFSQEQTRIDKVNRNWVIYKVIEVLIIITSKIVLLFAYQRDFWSGFAMAALIMASALIVLDVISEHNGRWYAEKLHAGYNIAVK
jgi:membrane protein YdbS with pleckstrin-like domain